MQLNFKSPCKTSTGNLKPKLFWAVVLFLLLFVGFVVFFSLRSVKQLELAVHVIYDSSASRTLDVVPRIYFFFNNMAV